MCLCCCGAQQNGVAAENIFFGKTCRVSVVCGFTSQNVVVVAVPLWFVVGRLVCTRLLSHVFRVSLRGLNGIVISCTTWIFPSVHVSLFA